ncbi:hypothetical protein TARUN_8724 [Trichoderma arundinaceum]|uniref:Uncharacterized protein n=1 Tax=Trichoderma arundinaceum TaxID=490622 RepID=A0A395NC28_TRIAR|nr:hypothetical protein TARUN_8724 [Trichoderma arundinaceum]
MPQALYAPVQATSHTGVDFLLSQSHDAAVDLLHCINGQMAAQHTTLLCMSSLLPGSVRQRRNKLLSIISRRRDWPGTAKTLAVRQATSLVAALPTLLPTPLRAFSASVREHVERSPQTAEAANGRRPRQQKLRQGWRIAGRRHQITAAATGAPLHRARSSSGKGWTLPRRSCPLSGGHDSRAASHAPALVLVQRLVQRPAPLTPVRSHPARDFRLATRRLVTVLSDSQQSAATQSRSRHRSPLVSQVHRPAARSFAPHPGPLPAYTTAAGVRLRQRATITKYRLSCHSLASEGHPTALPRILLFPHPVPSSPKPDQTGPDQARLGQGPCPDDSTTRLERSELHSLHVAVQLPRPMSC